MRRIPGPGAVLLAILLGAASVCPAAEDGGTRSVFAQGAGIRALSLGGAFTAVGDDASAVFWNPAGLGFLPRMEVQGGRSTLYGLDMAEEYAVLALPRWRLGTAAVTLRHFGVDGIEGRDARNVVTEDSFSSHQSELSLAYGRSFAGDAWSLGAALKLQTQSVGDLGATGFGMDVGATVRPAQVLGVGETWAPRWTLGLSVRNAVEPVVRLQSDAVRDPRTIRLGSAYEVPVGGTGTMLAAVDVETSAGVTPRIHGGVEFRYQGMIALRSGMTPAAFTAGAGVTWREFGFDYGYEANDVGSLHWLGLSARLGRSVAEQELSARLDEERRLERRLAETFDARRRDQSAALFAEAKTARGENRPDDAIRTLEVLATLDPDWPGRAELEAACWTDRARGHEARGAFTEAGLDYARALAADPDHAEAAAGQRRCRAESDRLAARTEDLRARFSRALDAFTEGRLLSARDTLRAILALEPADGDARAMLDRTEEAIRLRAQELTGEAERFARGGLFDEAENALRDAERLDPGAPGLAPAQRRLAGARAAAAEARTAGARETDATPPSTAASSPAGSAPAPRRATPEERERAEELFRQGVAAFEDSRTADAVRFWELTLSLDPQHGQARGVLKREYLTRGMDFFAAGELPDAVALWERALDMDPTDERARGYLARARQQLARTRELLGPTAR